MSIKVESTSEQPKPVTTEVVEAVETKPAAVETAAETLEASEPEETEIEAEGEELEAETEEGKPKKQGGYKRKIGKLTARATKAEQEAQFWREQALKKQEPEAKPVVEAKVYPEGKPSADKYDTHEEYVEALADWKVEQRLSAHEAKQRESSVKTEHQKQEQALAERVQKYRESHDDWDELMESVDDIPLSVTVRQAFLESENAPELMHALAKEPEVLKRICALPAVAAARELGRFEAGLSASEPKTTTELKTTKAPAPIKPVGSVSTSSSKRSIFDPNLSQQDYERLRKEQIAKRA